MSIMRTKRSLSVKWPDDVREVHKGLWMIAATTPRARRAMRMTTRLGWAIVDVL